MIMLYTLTHPGMVIRPEGIQPAQIAHDHVKWNQAAVEKHGEGDQEGHERHQLDVLAGQHEGAHGSQYHAERQ